MILLILGLIAVTIASVAVCIPFGRLIDAAIDRPFFAVDLDHLDASEVEV